MSNQSIKTKQEQGKSEEFLPGHQVYEDMNSAVDTDPASPVFFETSYPVYFM